MPEISVQITRFADGDFPGFVECHFVDALGRIHDFVEKVPVVSLEELTADSSYPRSGIIRCVIESEWQDEVGRQVVTVNTERPDGVESTEAQSRFVVFSALVNRC
jgi:hypothetical protein